MKIMDLIQGAVVSKGIAWKAVTTGKFDRYRQGECLAWSVILAATSFKDRYLYCVIDFSHDDSLFSLRDLVP